VKTSRFSDDARQREADGGARVGRVSFRLSGTPERRWLELFEVSKASAFREERSSEFLLHVQCAPGEVACKTRRKLKQALIADVNSADALNCFAACPGRNATTRKERSKKR